jgi:hypothetical protein
VITGEAIFLALGFDPTDGFFQRYFSFIVLGLVMTLGYVFHRVSQSRRKKATEKWGGVEEELRRAEAEALALARKRGVGVLALTPQEELERERLAALAGVSTEELESRIDEQDASPVSDHKRERDDRNKHEDF